VGGRDRRKIQAERHTLGGSRVRAGGWEGVTCRGVQRVGSKQSAAQQSAVLAVCNKPTHTVQRRHAVDGYTTASLEVSGCAHVGTAGATFMQACMQPSLQGRTWSTGCACWLSTSSSSPSSTATRTAGSVESNASWPACTGQDRPMDHRQYSTVQYSRQRGVKRQLARPHILVEFLTSMLPHRACVGACRSCVTKRD
jgi:hypothetical protein